MSDSSDSDSSGDELPEGVSFFGSSAATRKAVGTSACWRTSCHWWHTKLFGGATVVLLQALPGCVYAILLSALFVCVDISDSDSSSEDDEPDQKKLRTETLATAKHSLPSAHDLFSRSARPAFLSAGAGVYSVSWRSSCAAVAPLARAPAELALAALAWP